MCCSRGRFIALELKKDKAAKVSVMQMLELGRIEKAGGISIITYPDNWDETYRFLRHYAETGEELKNDKANFRPFN